VAISAVVVQSVVEEIATSNLDCVEVILAMTPHPLKLALVKVAAVF
jgi:hypothetical protein